MARFLEPDNALEKRSVKHRSGFLYAAFLSLFVLVISFSLGFVVFLSSINNYVNQTQVTNADGIVVLTGGYARLKPAVSLLKKKHAERLLISGVNRKTGDDLLKNVLEINDMLYTCCVDIDQDALDTVGNATGTAHWAKAKGYKHLIVVTNDYHMPRSLLELKRVIGDVKLTPYAISNSHSHESLFVMVDRYRVLLGEYGKLIAAFARGFYQDRNRRGTEMVAGASMGW